MFFMPLKSPFHDAISELNQYEHQVVLTFSHPSRPSSMTRTLQSVSATWHLIEKLISLSLSIVVILIPSNIVFITIITVCIVHSLMELPLRILLPAILLLYVHHITLSGPTSLLLLFLLLAYHWLALNIVNLLFSESIFLFIDTDQFAFSFIRCDFFIFALFMGLSG